MVAYYQIKSPLTQITDGHIHHYIQAVSRELGEDLIPADLETYLGQDFALLYVASGGSEGYFLEVFEKLRTRPCYILTSGESNSLAASMEILSYLHKHGGKGEILHGDIAQIAEKIRSLKAAHEAKASLRDKNIGLIGNRSDWLISSDYDPAILMEKLGMGFVNISMEELLAEIARESYVPNEHTARFLSQDYDRVEVEKALYVYGAIQRLCEKYHLSGVSVRCFDLLDTVHTTGCLALSILNDQGIAAGCEGDIPSLLSMVILQAVTGKPSFMCNPSQLRLQDGYGVFAHCTVPVSMLDSFCLNTHFESDIGVAVQGQLPSSPCTVFKCAGDLSRYFVCQGRVAPSPFDPMLCRTQVQVHLDSFDYFLTAPISNHHTLCLGSHAQEIETLFSIL